MTQAWTIPSKGNEKGAAFFHLDDSDQLFTNVEYASLKCQSIFKYHNHIPTGILRIRDSHLRISGDLVLTVIFLHGRDRSCPVCVNTCVLCNLCCTYRL